MHLFNKNKHITGSHSRRIYHRPKIKYVLPFSLIWTFDDLFSCIQKQLIIHYIRVTQRKMILAMLFSIVHSQANPHTDNFVQTAN